MPSGLPFITQPKAAETVEIGNDRTGILEIKKLGGLSINERKYLQQLTKDLPDLQRLAVKMADSIVKSRAAEGEKLELIDVYTALTKSNVEYLGNQLDAVLDFQDAMKLVNEQRAMALATMIVKFRIDPAWTEQDTCDLHPELLTLLAQFAAGEETNWADAEPGAEPEPTEEDLKNSSEETPAE